MKLKVPGRYEIKGQLDFLCLRQQEKEFGLCCMLEIQDLFRRAAKNKNLTSPMEKVENLGCGCGGIE